MAVLFVLLIEVLPSDTVNRATIRAILSNFINFLYSFIFTNFALGDRDEFYKLYI